MTRVPTSNSKYGNIREKIDGYSFDSRAEASRYLELKLLERSGEIERLIVHPRWELHAPTITGEQEKVCEYEADFEYWDNTTNMGVVEDVKSGATKTRLYIIKKKWLLLQYGIEVKEIMT